MLAFMEKKNLFGLIVIFIAILIAGWASLFGLSVENTIFEQQFYDTVIEETEIYSPVREAVLSQMGIEYGKAEEEGAQDSAVNIALQEAFDKNWIKQQMSNVAAEYVLFLKGEQEELSLTVDLQDRQEIFKDKLAVELDEKAPEELEHTELTEELVIEYLEKMEFPDTLVVTQIDDPEELDKEVVVGMSFIRNYRSYAMLFYFIMLALLIILAFSLAGFGRGAKWVGASLLASGISYLGGAMLVISSRKGSLKDSAFVEGLPEYGEIHFLLEDLAPLLPEVLNYAQSLIINYSLIYAAIGLVLLIIGFLATRGPTRHEQT